jgi:hypothetical protein
VNRFTLLLFAAAFSPLAAVADLVISCEKISENRSAGFCEVRVSDSRGNGEVKLDAAESFRLSQKSGCALGAVDLLIVNASAARRAVREGSFGANPTDYSISLVPQGAPSKKRRNADSASVVYARKDFQDSARLIVSGSLAYKVNGNGLRCSLSNH